MRKDGPLKNPKSEIDHGQGQPNLPKDLNLAIPPVRTIEFITFTHKVNTMEPDINKTYRINSVLRQGGLPERNILNFSQIRISGKIFLYISHSLYPFWNLPIKRTPSFPEPTSGSVISSLSMQQIRVINVLQDKKTFGRDYRGRNIKIHWCPE